MIKYGFLEKWCCVKCGLAIEAAPAAIHHEMEKAAMAEHQHQWEKLHEEDSDLRSDGITGSEEL